MRQRLETDQRFRALGNVLNLSTPLGLAIAVAGRSVIRRGPRGLIFAEGYRLGFPPAGAFTVGNVVISAHQLDDLQRGRPLLIDHEDVHAWQYLLCAGLPFLPLYALAAFWSWGRTGDLAASNPFERQAGLPEGGYVERPVTNEGFRRLQRSAAGLIGTLRR